MSAYPKIDILLEELYPDYTVDSFKIRRDAGGGVYVLQDVKLTGKHMLSEDGRIDGQPLPMIIAPSQMWGDLAGFVIKVSTPEEETSFDI